MELIKIRYRRRRRSGLSQQAGAGRSRRRSSRRRKRSAVLAEPGRAGRTTASTRCCTANFRARPRVDWRRRFAPRLPEADERFDGAGRPVGCVKQPLEPIVPYVRQPEEIVLGKPLFFASAMPFGGMACRCWSRSHEGRPTKIEGNPEHPAGMGGSGHFRAGVDPRHVRSRPLADHELPGRDARPGSVSWRQWRHR